MWATSQRENRVRTNHSVKSPYHHNFIASTLLYGELAISFFFFQAEDGIRDLTVTGVQTCALPICPLSSHSSKTMSTKTDRYIFDWWVVEKRSLYLLIALVILCVLAGTTALYVWKFGNPLKNVGSRVKMPDGARLISFEGDVRIIRAATRETIAPGSDTELYPGDTVQTQANGRARVSMADGSTLVVRPNSTIIVRDNARADDGKKTNVHVVVDSGQMSVRTEEQPEGTNNVVETHKTTNKMGGQTGASFGVNAEGTEEIRVNSGAIETTNRNGEKTI